jgi:uncharacterized protein
MEILQNYPISGTQWAVAAFAAVLMGMSKGGLNSASFASVPLMAWVFGGKISTGIVLPLLIAGDVLAVMYYKRLAQWELLFRLMPTVVVGILLATWFGKDLDEQAFKKMMAAIILILVTVMLYFERKPATKITESPIFSSIMGISTGFTTMIGNQAGGFATTFLLTQNISKNVFIGTNAWLFMLINTFKLPLHIFVWHTVSAQSLPVNVVLLPFIVLGFWLGTTLAKRMSEVFFRRFIIVLALVGTLFILFDL